MRSRWLFISGANNTCERQKPIPANVHPKEIMIQNLLGIYRMLEGPIIHTPALIKKQQNVNWSFCGTLLRIIGATMQQMT